jgi:pimeloyl-ACP methyl ester carboxylesterase
MRGVRIVLMIGAFALAGAAVAAGALNPASPARHCKAGSTSATIAGKHVCLRAGARCTKSLDRRYHRFRFHCHSGRLTRFATPVPPGMPPTLSEPPAPTGRLVDVGGYRILLECTGTGAPTVVLEAGSSAPRLPYRKVQYALAADTRVCSYDRPGALPSASDPRPASTAATSATFSRELRTVLANAGERGPYLLAAHSFGGLLVSAFTARYPDDVAGLVFVDALAPARAAAFATPGVLPEVWDARADVALIESVAWGSRPVVVLTTTQPLEAPDVRRRGTNVLAAAAPQHSHFVFGDVPGLAYETIRVAIAAVRAGGALPACAQTRLPQIGARCTP